EVAVERPMRHTFTYIADAFMPALKRGARVIVPFGKGTAPGFVVELKNADEFKRAGFDPSKLRGIVSVLDGGRPVVTEALLKASDAPLSALKALEKAKLLRTIERSNFEIEASNASQARTTTLVLNQEQHDAFRKIESALAVAEASGFLLQGVTGSGKTEVYL